MSMMSDQILRKKYKVTVSKIWEMLFDFKPGMDHAGQILHFSKLFNNVLK